jgi:murein DD-endopeptidase MepM/ murein hydrolase activator NlpD
LHGPNRLWYISRVPRLRHPRPVLLALPLTALLAVAWAGLFGVPTSLTDLRPGLGVTDVAAAPTPPAAAAAGTLPRRLADPGSRREEVGHPLPPSPSVLRGYVWPLANARLTLGFEQSRWGSRLVDGKLFHDGIDLATTCGDRIVAAHDGVVLAAGRRYDEFMGWQGDLQPYFDRLDEKDAWLSLPIVIVIDDGNGYRSIYAHFSRVVVKPGERVRAGQLIGYEGRTGRASGCHLHYGLFSPLETKVFEISPTVVEHLLVPRYQTARIDPRLVLPKLAPPERPATQPWPIERPPADVPEPSPALLH